VLNDDGWMVYCAYYIEKTIYFFNIIATNLFLVDLPPAPLPHPQRAASGDSDPPRAAAAAAACIKTRAAVRGRG
jgi:hypothetical protein